MGFIAKLLGKKQETLDSLAQDIFTTAKSSCQTFVKNLASSVDGDKPNSNRYVNAGYEFLYFFIHYVNRVAYSEGGVPAQEKLHTELSMRVVHKVASTTSNEHLRDFIVSTLQKGINQSETRYSQCKRIFPETNEAANGALFWEAAKNISNAAGGGSDIANLVAAMEIMTNSLASLRLNERVKTLARAD